MRGRDLPEFVLDQVQVFDQQVPVARAVDEQRLDLVVGARVDLTALGNRARPITAAPRVLELANLAGIVWMIWFAHAPMSKIVRGPKQRRILQEAPGRAHGGICPFALSQHLTAIGAENFAAAPRYEYELDCIGWYSADMKRTNRRREVVFIDQEKSYLLAQLANQIGIPRAAVLREAIDDVLVKYGMVKQVRDTARPFALDGVKKKP